MERERPEGSFLYGQSHTINEADLPTRKEKVSAKALKSFIWRGLLGAVLGLGLVKTAEQSQVNAQEPISGPAVTRTFEEPPCGDFGDVDDDGRITSIDANLALNQEIG